MILVLMLAIEMVLLNGQRAQASAATQAPVQCQDCELTLQQQALQKSEQHSLEMLLERNRSYHYGLHSRQRSAALKIESNIRLIQDRQSEIQKNLTQLEVSIQKKGCGQCPQKQNVN